MKWLQTKLLKLLSILANPKWVHNYKEFVPGKTPVYYSGAYFDNTEIESALTAFLTGKWITAGEHVHKFQIEFAKKFKTKYAHMVNSGSSANLILITALKKHLKWNDGDEIIVSPVGFPTTISPIAQNNLTPVFIDIEMETLNFDISLITEKITSRTRAIFVSPVLGNAPNIDMLIELAKDKNILLIGDNCDSLGSKWNGKYLNEYYYAWTTSFYPAHHITTGEGGMVCSDDEQLISLCRSLTWWGRDCYCVGAANLLACGTCGKRFDRWLEKYDGVVDHKYIFTTMGYNLKPLDLQGAIGSAQLKKFETIHTSRRRNKQIIHDIIERYIPEARVVDESPLCETSWFGVPIVVDSVEVKEKLQQFFETNKIQTRNYFAGNILFHPGYAHLGDYADYPNANKALSNVFFIGCPPHYNDEVLKYIEEVCSKWTN